MAEHYEDQCIKYDALIVVTPKDYLRVEKHYPRLLNWLPVRKLIFIGNSEVGEYVQRSALGERVGFVNENDLLPFQDVHNVMKEALKDIVTGELPRGITGWYYQQFLKMSYASICRDEYYMVWDGDTVPCGPITMFNEEGIPYLDLKTECHREYFKTLEKLLGMRKCIERSFIAEHMLFKKEIMLSLIRDIMKNNALAGDTYYEKIIHAVELSELMNNSYSEFETYGTYVAFRHPMAYKLREWHSFRYGGEFFEVNEVTDSDFQWLYKDFYAISFEKAHFVREDHKNLFTNKEYQKRISARRMLEEAQKEFGNDSYQELWSDSAERYIQLASECEQKEDYEGMFRRIREGLKIDPMNYELFYMLGYYYYRKNMNQAYLCFEQALYFCHDENDCKTIQEDINTVLQSGLVNVNKVAFVITPYNCGSIQQQVIESIQATMPKESYQIVVIEKASTDGIPEWLKEQQDIKLIVNDRKLGLAVACNQGAAFVSGGEEAYDVMLLDNNTCVTDNSMFWLRMGLYESENIGATGSISNHAGNKQQVDVTFEIPQSYFEYAKGMNIPAEYPYEERPRLCGFAMLIRSVVWQQLGGMDEAFAAELMDDDLSTRIRTAGYRLFVCRNSFIFYAGSQNAALKEEENKLSTDHSNYFIQKHGFDISQVIYPDMNKLYEIPFDTEDQFTILVNQCGIGAEMMAIQSLFPNAYVVGIEPNNHMRKVCNNMAVFSGTQEMMVCLGEIHIDYELIAR